jgi:DNA-binding Lrp family transcriptional regulator
MDEKVLLMEVQYNLPLTEQPFVDLAENLGLNPKVVMDKLRELKTNGVIKRIGANLNYKAFRRINKAVLVAFACKDDDVLRIAEIINSSLDSLSLKHNFWRDHEKYKVWFTFKGKNEEDLLDKVKELAGKCGVDDYLFLPSKRVYKMDVKYDLFKGISWSEKGLEKESVPLAEEMGLSAEMLMKLEKRLPIAERPFKEIAEAYGYKEGELVDLISELIKKGVVRDFSGVLRESKIGFRENGMNLVKIEPKEAEKIALKLVKDFPQITHLVERSVPENWKYPIYFMIHADSRQKIESIRREVSERFGVEVITLYSKMNLKPD